MRCGNVVVSSGLPGQFPPTATFRIKNWGALNTQLPPPGRSAGGVVPSPECLRTSLDHETSVLDACVLRPVGMILKLVVAPAVITIAGIVSPLAGIRRQAVRLSEFIRPQQGSAGDFLRMSAKGDEERQRQVSHAQGMLGRLDGSGRGGGRDGALVLGDDLEVHRPRADISTRHDDDELPDIGVMFPHR